MGEAARLRARAGARVARTDRDGTPARPAERDDARLRVRDAAAPARHARRHARRRTRSDPARTARAFWSPPPEAAALPRTEGGVLPLRLRAGPARARGAERRPQPRPGRLASAAGRLAVSPPLEPALSPDARLPRRASRGAGGRAATRRGAARVRRAAGPAVHRRPRKSRRRAE